MTPIRHLKVGRLGRRTFRYDKERDVVFEVFRIDCHRLIEQFASTDYGLHENIKLMEELRSKFHGLTY